MSSDNCVPAWSSRNFRVFCCAAQHLEGDELKYAKDSGRIPGPRTQRISKLMASLPLVGEGLNDSQLSGRRKSEPRC
jgi:hypothetical protein